MGYTAPRDPDRILNVQIEGRKRPCRAVQTRARVRRCGDEGVLGPEMPPSIRLCTRPRDSPQPGPRLTCSEGIRSLLSWPPPSRSSNAAATRRELASARAACSVQGRCLSTYPGWAPSRVLCSGRLSQTVARQLAESAGHALRVQDSLPLVRAPDPSAGRAQGGAAQPLWRRIPAAVFGSLSHRSALLRRTRPVEAAQDAVA